MAIWLTYKAKPCEKNKRKSYTQQRPKLCRICGKPVNNGGHICDSCKEFIKHKKQEERTS